MGITEKSGLHLAPLRLATLSLATLGLVACDVVQEQSGSDMATTTADWILTNGQILTVDAEFSSAEAMAIQDDRVLATGSNDEINALAGAATRRTDLEGRTLVPGLIDNHMHFVRATQQWYRHVRWDGVKSREQAFEMIRERADELPEGEWVVVIGGWNFAQFRDNQDLFSVAELDNIAPGRPIYIQEGYRRGFANSAALAAAGVSAATLFEGRGGLIKDETGALTGELAGGAMDLVTPFLPEVSADVWDASLQQTINSLHQMGLTSVYDVGGNTVTPGHYDSVARAAASDDLSMRVFYTLNGQNSDDGSAEAIIAALSDNSPDNEGLRFAQFGYGETVYRPMRANPFQISTEDREKFYSIALTAAENGWQLNEHSFTDEKVSEMLNVFGEVNETNPITDMRWTIAHNNMISPQSIQRAMDLGMVFAVHSSRRTVTPAAISNAGADGRRQPPARTIHELGGVWGLGSDATTVASPNPFHTLGWVVSGRSISGDTTLSETVSREAALTAHTRTNAYMMFREDDLGSLEPGKLADFVVLDRDYLTVHPAVIENLRSLMTVVGGEVVYSAL
jgi:predicted amidohydrolase YtcJ